MDDTQTYENGFVACDRPMTETARDRAMLLSFADSDAECAKMECEDVAAAKKRRAKIARTLGALKHEMPDYGDLCAIKCRCIESTVYVEKVA